MKTNLRRTALAAATAAAALVAVAMPVARQTQTAPSPAPARFIIDSHQHYRDDPTYIDALVKVYRPRKAMACVLTPIQGLEVVRKAAAAHPDVVIPYGHVNVDDPDTPAQIDRFAKAGFKGIKMHRPKRDWDDFGYFPIYHKLQALNLVALFHTGIVAGSSGDDPEPSSMARMRPAFLHTIARSFPTLRIQGAHLGNPWYDEAAEAARWEKNLYFDRDRIHPVEEGEESGGVQRISLVGGAVSAQRPGRRLCLREAGVRDRRAAGESG